MKKALLIMIILISLCINPQITKTVGAEDPSGGIIDGESVYWENDWGRLEVYPHTTWGEIHQEQYCNATWKLAANDLDIAFRFNDSLIDAHVYEWIGSEWNEVTGAFQHTIYNGKHYYYVESVHFDQDETRRFKWNYDVPFNSSGKWDFMAKLSSESIQYALDNDRYVMLDPWWNTDWGYNRIITIESDYVDTDLLNFPVMVLIPNSIGQYCDDGNSIRFLDMNNVTTYYYEIDEWNASGDSYIWVNVTGVQSDSDTQFLMYYNNTGASDAQDAANTWDDYFVGVWHMHDGNDSSGNGNTGIDRNVSDGNAIANITTGKMGSAKDLELDDQQYLNVSHATSLNLNDSTLEAWINMESISADMDIFDKTLASQTLRFFFDQPADRLVFEVASSGQALGNTSDLGSTSTWFYCAGTRDRLPGSELITLYINGTISGTPSASIDEDATNNVELILGGTENFDGILDEMRISNVARNASWLNATYHTINIPTVFCTFGSQQAGPGVSLAVNATTNITNHNATLNGYLPNTANYSGTYDYGFWVGDTVGVTEDTKDFNFTGSGTITPDTLFNTTASGLTEETTYYVKSWVANATGFNISYNEISFTTYAIPDPPTNGQAVYWGGGHHLNLTWTRSTHSDKEIVVRNYNNFPSTPEDGTVMQNNTVATYYNVSSIYNYSYYTVWSYNDTLNASSLTGLDISWGAMGINVYNESDGSPLTFDIEIKNSDGSSVYTNTSLTNPHYISTADIPYGDDTYFRISSNYEREYNSRVYYFDTALNNFYNLSFYLCDYNDSELYRFDVTDQANQPVDECRIQVQRYIANTSQYENVSILFTDGAGYAFLFLIPETTYQITLSKDGYQTQIAEYIPFADVFTHSFVLLFEEEEFENITGDWWEDITFEGYMSSTTLTVNYTDNLDQTINVSFIVYEYNYTTYNYTAVYWWNSTDQADPTDNDFQFSTSVNSSNYHRVQMFLNHTTHGYILHSIEFLPVDQAYRDITTITRLDELLDDILGENPFGWGNFFAFIVLIAGLFSFGEQGVGISLMGTGFLFLFLSVVIGIFAIMVVVPVLFIVLGILVEWNVRQRRLKY